MWMYVVWRYDVDVVCECILKGHAQHTHSKRTHTRNGSLDNVLIGKSGPHTLAWVSGSYLEV